VAFHAPTSRAFTNNLFSLPNWQHEIITSSWCLYCGRGIVPLGTRLAGRRTHLAGSAREGDIGNPGQRQFAFFLHALRLTFVSCSKRGRWERRMGLFQQPQRDESWILFIAIMLAPFGTNAECQLGYHHIKGMGCMFCYYGQYGFDVFGEHTCMHCPSSKYQSAYGQTSCIQCPSHYATKPKSLAPTKCIKIAGPTPPPTPVFCGPGTFHQVSFGTICISLAHTLSTGSD
jgi:hypothetical protein